MPFSKNDPNINRNGRPKGSKGFTTKVRAALEKIAEGSESTYEEALVKSILDKAIKKGDPAIQKLIWNYLDGMPHQSSEIEHKIPETLLDLLTNADDYQTKDTNAKEQDKE